MDEYYYEEYEAPNAGSRKLSIASLILAALSVLLSSVFYFSVPMAALSVILALLSRGKGKMGYRGKLAVMVSCAAITFSLVSTAVLIYRIETTPALKQRLQYLVDQLYGSSFQDNYTAPSQSLPDTQPDPAPNLTDPILDLTNPVPEVPRWNLEGGDMI